VGAVHPDDSFDVLFQGVKQGTVRWGLMGEHNRANALAALAAARHAGVRPVAIEALARFEGVKRRMECAASSNGITVYDDFAHHPTAFATTIAGCGGASASAHRRGVRAALQHDEARHDAGSHRARASKAPTSSICYAKNLGWDPARALARSARARRSTRTSSRWWSARPRAAPGDHVLVMSNGGFGGIHEKLLDALARGAARA
jgi:UDP-N-acetylmuramate: L-alanyl-gamma-D-glutamyl-meso-diaminopimelate ligase